MDARAISISRASGIWSIRICGSSRVPVTLERSYGDGPPGCEALDETGRRDDPHKLLFFEAFSSLASLDGKLSGVPPLTQLSAL